MMIMTRRRLFAGGAAAAALALGGCSALQSITTTQLQQDAATLAAGLAAVENALVGAGLNIPQAVIDKANALIAQVQANASTLASDLAPSQQTLQAIASGVSALSILLTPFFPQAAGIGAAVQAALALVGFILQQAGVVLPPSARQGVGATAMTADQARAILNSAAAAGIH